MNDFWTIDVADWTLPRIGLGAMWVNRCSPEATRTLLGRAVELGVRFIDTSHTYADSEETIGKVLRRTSEKVLVATKGGVHVTGPRNAPRQDATPAGLRRACETSLQRLGVEALDLLQLHWPDPEVPFAESIGALAGLRQAGLVRHVGLCNVGLAEIEEAMAITPIVSVQNRYNHADRSSERVVEFCNGRGIAFLPYSPMQVGDDAAVTEVAGRLGVRSAQVALAWLLYRSPNILPIPGTSSISHLEENVAAADLILDEEALAALAGSGKEGMDDPKWRPANWFEQPENQPRIAGLV